MASITWTSLPIYVGNFGSNTISVIDGATNAVSTTISGGNGPATAGVNPTTDRVYVVNFNGNDVSVIGDDGDGDGIPDNTDQCDMTDPMPPSTVIIDGCDSGVPDQLLSDPLGCTIEDQIEACAANASNHGEFVSCVASLTNALKKDKIIAGQEKGAIQSCAAQANIP